MPSEDDLRDLFASSAVPHHIDTKRVIAKSRARRLPRQLAIGAAGTLAIVGIVVVSLPALLPHQSAVSTLSEGGAPAPNPQAFDAAKRAPAEKINLCGGPLAQPAPSFYGLQLDVEFPPTATVGNAAVEGTVRLTNTGNQTVTGSTATTPTVTLSQDGVVFWHSNGIRSQVALQVDLAPGQSLQYQASFSPVRCAPQDEDGEGFPPDLPAVAPGGYYLSAAIDFLPDAAMTQQSTPGLDLVTGPLAPIELQ